MRSKPTTNWPFWIFIIAWAWTNTPPELADRMAAWTKGAGHFSHQKQLASDVAFLLAGGKTPGMLAFLKSVSQPQAPTPLASWTPDTLAKKIDLCLPAAEDAMPRLFSPQRYASLDMCVPDARCGEPAEEPPRA